MHTLRRTRPIPSTASASTSSSRSNQGQRRKLHLSGQPAIGLLEAALDNTSIHKDAPQGTDSYYLSIAVDRSDRQPCSLVSPTTEPSAVHRRQRRFPYDHREGPSQETIQSAVRHLQLDAAPPAARAQVADLISKLTRYHKDKEAISITTSLTVDSSGSLALHDPRLHFDPSAFKSKKRQEDIHKLRRKDLEDPSEVLAEDSGIVYVKLHPDDKSASIGTLVNGAGLAMNTLDSLSLPPLNGKCTNFLDTGGKATSQTVKTSFELILADERVKVIFVNIFGGLTDCGMIAEGVLLAFKEVDMRGVPVVVRLRGTNEEVGQKTIAESGLGLEAFDGFAEAAARVVELSRA